MALLEPLYAGLPTTTERLIASAKLYALVGAYPPTLLLGVPAYFVLRRHFAPRLLACALAGAGVAAIPWLLLVLAARPTTASIGGRATVIDGQYTAYGWLVNGSFLGEIALVGCAAGLVFWAIAGSRFSQSNVRNGSKAATRGRLAFGQNPPYGNTAKSGSTHPSRASRENSSSRE